ERVVFDLDIAGNVNLAELGVAGGTDQHRTVDRVELSPLIKCRSLLHEDRKSNRAGVQRASTSQPDRSAPSRVQCGVVGLGGGQYVVARQGTRPKVNADGTCSRLNDGVAFDLRGG